MTEVWEVREHYHAQDLRGTRIALCLGEEAAQIIIAALEPEDGQGDTQFTKRKTRRTRL